MKAACLRSQRLLQYRLDDSLNDAYHDSYNQVPVGKNDVNFENKRTTASESSRGWTDGCSLESGEFVVR